MTITLVMHARTKHVEMNYRFVHEKVDMRQLLTHFVYSKDKLVDIHTKVFTKHVFSDFCSKLGVTVRPLDSNLFDRNNMRTSVYHSV